MRRGRTLRLILSLLLIGGGIYVAIWPFWQQSKSQSQNDEIIKEYEESIGKLTEQEINEMYVEASLYNKGCAEKRTYDGVYDELLSVGEDGVMGIVIIPKLQVMLPIYHDTSDDVLAKGVGHLKGSSLPSGDKASHVVLCGHSGYPSLYAFDDIDSLEAGDKVYIRVLDQMYAYGVDKSVVVKPDEVNPYIEINAGENTLTLLTCTPYGINTHRLLVQAAAEEHGDLPLQLRGSEDAGYFVITIGLAIGLVILGIFIGCRHKKKIGGKRK